MKIISFNVNGIRAIAKKSLFEDIKTMNPDIIGFQETKANNEQVKETIGKLEGYHLYVSSAERPGYSGTAVLSKVKALNFIEGLGIDEHDKEGRTITLELEKFYLINSYSVETNTKKRREISKNCIKQLQSCFFK